MKFLHLSDLHLGKILHRMSLVESGDQPFWIDGILHFIHVQKPDAVIFAGDVYDRSIPSREAVTCLSRLLTGIARENIPVFLIAGNHDGGERLEFLPEVLKERNIHIAGTVRRDMVHVTRDFGDGFGPVTFWLMPYVFPAAVRQALDLSEGDISSFEQAVSKLLEAQDIDFSTRNVLIAHQMVLHASGEEPEHGKSETAVGGVGGISAGVFDGFDYVALGHIHGAQSAGGEHIRYCGSPLCYHFDEAKQKKGPLMVSLGAKGTLPEVEMMELSPLHRMRAVMRGTLDEIIATEKASTARGEYVSVELTDDFLRPDARETLTALFESHDCILLDVSRIPSSRRSAAASDTDSAAREMSLEDYFLGFYEKYSAADPIPSCSDQALIRFAAEQIEHDSGCEETDDTLADKLAEFALRQEVNGK